MYSNLIWQCSFEVAWYIKPLIVPSKNIYAIKVYLFVRKLKAVLLIASTRYSLCPLLENPYLRTLQDRSKEM